jgi:hypothetical protein
VPGSSEVGSVDVRGEPQKQANAPPVDHGVLYASRLTKAPCSSHHHLASLLPFASHTVCKPLREGVARDQDRSLVAKFESLTVPRGASRVRYRLSSLLA